MADSDWLDVYLESAKTLKARAKAASKQKTAGSPTATRENQHSYLISYAHENVAAADLVELLLRRRRRKVWRDELSVDAGERISDTVKHGITRCDTFIALWSKEYERSEWCKQELEHAMRTRAQSKSGHSAPGGCRAARIVLIQLDDTDPFWRIAPERSLKGSTREALQLAVQQLIESEG